jgi:hypothetical protein
MTDVKLGDVAATVDEVSELGEEDVAVEGNVEESGFADVLVLWDTDRDAVVDTVDVAEDAVVDTDEDVVEGETLWEEDFVEDSDFVVVISDIDIDESTEVVPIEDTVDEDAGEESDFVVVDVDCTELDTDGDVRIGVDEIVFEDEDTDTEDKDEEVVVETEGESDVDAVDVVNVGDTDEDAGVDVPTDTVTDSVSEFVTEVVREDGVTEVVVATDEVAVKDSDFSVVDVCWDDEAGIDEDTFNKNLKINVKFKVQEKIVLFYLKSPTV